MTEVLTIPKLSEKTGVPAYSIRKLIREGRLPVLKMGGKFFVKTEDFNALFKTEER